MKWQRNNLSYKKGLLSFVFANIIHNTRTHQVKVCESFWFTIIAKIVVTEFYEGGY